MPYENLSDLPESARQHLPHHAQEIYRAAYNPAEDQYGEDCPARPVACSAFENKYENDGGDWTEKK